MRSRSVPIVAVSVALVVACCFAAENFDTYTRPHDLNGLGFKKHVPIGFGWPFVCLQGMIKKDCYTDQRGGVPCLFFWNNTEKPRIAWFGLLANTAICGLIVNVAFNATKWIGTRLQWKVSIATAFGCTTFAAFVMTARKPLFDWYLAHPNGSVPTILIGTAFHYAELTVWWAIFVCCIWMPNTIGTVIHRRFNQRTKDCTEVDDQPRSDGQSPPSAR